MIVLSYVQAREIIASQPRKLKELNISLDLGISKSKIKFEDDTILFPDGQKLVV